MPEIEIIFKNIKSATVKCFEASKQNVKIVIEASTVPTTEAPPTYNSPYEDSDTDGAVRHKPTCVRELNFDK